MANSLPSMPQWEPDTEASRIARPNSLIVRPEIPWKRQLMFGVLFGGWSLLMGGGVVLLYPEHRAVVVGCIATVVTVLLAGGAELYLISCFSKLIVDRDALIVSAFGVSRTFSRGSLAQIARASLDVTVRSSFTLSYYVFMRTDGRSAFKLSAKWWPDAGIVGVAATLGIPLSGSFFEIVDGPSFRRKFPKSIPWVVAHPRLAATLIGLLSLPVLVVTMMVVVILQGKMPGL